MKGFQAIFGLDVSKALAGFDKIEREGKKTGNALKATFAAIGPHIAAAFSVAAIKGAVDGMSQLYHTAQQLGASVEDLQFFRYIFESIDMPAQMADKALAGFQKRLGEAAMGGGELLTVANDLGIALTDASGKALSTNDALAQVATAIKNAETQAQAMVIATKAFGRETGQGMVEALRDGNKGLGEMRQKFDELNAVTTREAAEAAKLTQEWTNASTFISNTFAKAIIGLVDAYKKAQAAGQMAFESLIGLIAAGNQKIYETIASVGEFALSLEKIPVLGKAFGLVAGGFDDIRKNTEAAREKAVQYGVDVVAAGEAVDASAKRLADLMAGEVAGSFNKAGEAGVGAFKGVQTEIDNTIAMAQKVEAALNGFFDGLDKQAAAIDAKLKNIKPPNAGGGNGGGGNGKGDPNKPPPPPSWNLSDMHGSAQNRFNFGFNDPKYGTQTAFVAQDVRGYTDQELRRALEVVAKDMQSYVAVNSKLIGGFKGGGMGTDYATAVQRESLKSYRDALTRIEDELRSRSLLTIGSARVGSDIDSVLRRIDQNLSGNNNASSIMQDQLQMLSRISTKLDKSTIIQRGTP